MFEKNRLVILQSPVNRVPGAVVSLMDRTNVETVIVAGKVRKWKGRLLDVDLPVPAPPA
jgi:5-methylthioadenosine/S-adenosylhomocysteine deaminase